MADTRGVAQAMQDLGVGDEEGALLLALLAAMDTPLLAGGEISVPIQVVLDAVGGKEARAVELLGKLMHTRRFSSDPNVFLVGRILDGYGYGQQQANFRFSLGRLFLDLVASTPKS